jgi:hypothetical protein
MRESQQTKAASMASAAATDRLQFLMQQAEVFTHFVHPAAGAEGGGGGAGAGAGAGDGAGGGGAGRGRRGKKTAAAEDEALDVGALFCKRGGRDCGARHVRMNQICGRVFGASARAKPPAHSLFNTFSCHRRGLPCSLVGLRSNTDSTLAAPPSSSSSTQLTGALA